MKVETNNQPWKTWSQSTKMNNPNGLTFVKESKVKWSSTIRYFNPSFLWIHLDGIVLSNKEGVCRKKCKSPCHLLQDRSSMGVELQARWVDRKLNQLKTSTTSMLWKPTSRHSRGRRRSSTSLVRCRPRFRNQLERALIASFRRLMDNDLLQTI